MIAWIWFRELWEFSGCSPVKFSAVNDDTADSCSMSTNEFGCGMNHDICAVLDWTDQIWCAERIVDDKWNFMFVCNLCECFDIHYFRVWIAECLNVNCFCVVLDSAFYFL